MKITMYSTTWCADCYRAKSFLELHQIKFENYDIEANPQYVEVVEKFNDGNQTVPTIIIEYDDGTKKVLSEPSNAELAKALNLVIKTFRD